MGSHPPANCFVIDIASSQMLVLALKFSGKVMFSKISVNASRRLSKIAQRNLGAGDAYPCAEAAQPYRDRTWLAARQRANLPDLDQIFSATMKEIEPMPRQIAVELILRGQHRPLRMPAFVLPDAAAALGMLDHWRVREEVDPHIADRAERLIDPLGRVASS
jgi:hypothetical protein